MEVLSAASGRRRPLRDGPEGTDAKTFFATAMWFLAPLGSSRSNEVEPSIPR